MDTLVPFRDDAENRIICLEAEVEELKKKVDSLDRKRSINETLAKLYPHFIYYGFSVSVWLISYVGALIDGHTNPAHSFGIAFCVTWIAYFATLLCKYFNDNY